MTQSWDEFKKSKQAEFGLVVVEQPIQRPPTRYEQRPTEPPVKRFNIHKRSLPIGRPPLDIIVVFNVSKKDATWWVEHRLKTKCYQDLDDNKTIIYYDIIPVDAQPKERSIYYNPRPVVVEDGFGPVD